MALLLGKYDEMGYDWEMYFDCMPMGCYGVYSSHSVTA